MQVPFREKDARQAKAGRRAHEERSEVLEHEVNFADGDRGQLRQVCGRKPTDGEAEEVEQIAQALEGNLFGTKDAELVEKPLGAVHELVQGSDALGTREQSWKDEVHQEGLLRRVHLAGLQVARGRRAVVCEAEGGDNFEEAHL